MDPIRHAFIFANNGVVLSSERADAGRQKQLRRSRPPITSSTTPDSCKYGIIGSSLFRELMFLRARICLCVINDAVQPQ